jgi:putative SOS response-associated peptidase YedK
MPRCCHQTPLRSPFKRGRCLIPASGYFEWQPTPNGKQPYYISAADGSVLSMAGLWEQWTDIETGALLHHHRNCGQRAHPYHS